MDSRLVRLGNFLVFNVACSQEQLKAVEQAATSEVAGVVIASLSGASFGLVVWPHDGQDLTHAIFSVCVKVWLLLKAEGLVKGDVPGPIEGNPLLLGLNARSSLRVGSDGVVYTGTTPIGRLPSETAPEVITQGDLGGGYRLLRRPPDPLDM